MSDALMAGSEVRVIERHMGWRPGHEGESGGLYAYLTSLSTEGPHGGPFVYRSADTNMLAWVCERASGVRRPDGGPGVHPHLGPDGRRVRRRDHL